MHKIQNQVGSTKSITDYHRATRWLESLIGLPIYDHRDFPSEKGEPFILGLRRFVDFLETLECPGSCVPSDPPESADYQVYHQQPKFYSSLMFPFIGLIMA